MAECPCSNISIMQLFHELKQKFPAIPDRIVTECIELNAHDKEACEAVLSRENQAYSFPGDRVCKMATEPCRPNTLQLEDVVWDFDRRLLGRQSLDSLRCSRSSASRMCKNYSEEFLSNTNRHSDETLGAFSRLSICDESWNRRSQTNYQEEAGVGSGSDDSCHCERTRVSVVSYGPHSAPVTPSNYPNPQFPPLTVDVTTQRHCTMLNVEPAPHYQGVPEPVRPYTSVNLTLRLPSSNPQPPINISSGSSGMTYSSCSYDPRQGFQSRLQISIGSQGQGTVTAARTMAHRPPPSPPTLRPATSLPDVATTSSQYMDPSLQHLPRAKTALLTEQLERKEKLSKELSRNKERLNSMKIDVFNMKSDLESRQQSITPSSKVKKLREEIILLQTECNRMVNEVWHNSDMPLGETNEEFYKHIYRGQCFTRQPTTRLTGGGGGVCVAEEVRNWTCHVCTFHNHPALNKCEQCDMPRIITGAETQNIHIHVTHNVPSSPYRRVVHSWVV